MPLPWGRQQLESSGGLNLAKGPGEVIQLFGGKGEDDLSLWPFSFSVNGCPVSQITCLLRLQCARPNTQRSGTRKDIRCPCNDSMAT